MYQQIQTIKQNERCTSTSFNYNPELPYLAFTEGNHSKIYNIDDINNFNSNEGVNTKNLLKTRDTIIQSRFKLILSDMSNCIQAFNVEKDFEEISKIETSSLKIWKFEISPNNNLLATGTNSIMLYEIESGQKIYEISNDNKDIYTMAYLNENTLSIGNTNGSISIFNTDIRRKVLSLKDNNLAIRSLCHDETNNRLISGSDDLHMYVYNTKDFKNTYCLVGHKYEISNIQYNSEKNIYASSSFDGTLKIWDAKLCSKNNLLQTIDLNSLSSITQNNFSNTPAKDENNIIWDISFSSNGKYLMAGSEYGLHMFSC